MGNDETENRIRFLAESTGVGSRAPFAMDPDAGYDSDDLDRIAAAWDRDRYAREESDLSDMADFRAADRYDDIPWDDPAAE